MWERKELKQRAKACLKLYYWPAVLVVLIASVLCGVGTIFVAPDIEATKAELYAVLRCGAQPAGLKGFEV